MQQKNQIDHHQLQQTIKQGVDYLISKQEDGAWKGFPTLAGESNIWVTGFILAHISTLIQDTSIIKLSAQFLRNAIHPTGGWSYSQFVPSDADSTAWCMMALQQNKALNENELVQAKQFLWSHIINKAVSTYRVDSGILDFIGIPDPQFIAGWISPHPDVTIAAILADPQNEINAERINALIALQNEVGFFPAYWWISSLYTTTLLLRALTVRQEKLPLQQLALLEKGLQQWSLNESAFETALALELFSYLNGFESNCEAAIMQLLNTQQADGSWKGEYILRIPAPNIIHPNEIDSWNNSSGGGNSLIEDKDGLFATTMAVYALSAWRKKGQTIV